MAAIMKEEHGKRFYATPDGFVVSQACIAFRTFAFSPEQPDFLRSHFEDMGRGALDRYIESIGGERFGEHSITYLNDIPVVDPDTDEVIGTMNQMTVESGYWPSID